MAGYSLTTFGQLQAALSTRLGDPTNQWWTQAEVQFYVQEAMQVWQAFSQFYSIKSTFNTVSGQLFYDLFSLVPQIVPTTTDQTLIKAIQMHLQEPVNATAWTGTPQFSYSQMVSAIQKRRDLFLVETGLVQASSTQAVGIGNGEVPLDDNVMDVRRAMWVGGTGVNYTLWRADEFTLTAGDPSWFNTAGTPSDFSTVLQQPLGLQLSPPPIDAGTLDLLVTNSGGNLTPASGPTILGIPNDFVWVIKFGVLSDLLSAAGPGNDQYRADYFESRWMDGLELARITNFVKFGQQNGVPMFVDSLEELDTAQTTWMNQTGVPYGLALAGNFLAATPVADSHGPYSILLDVTPNMVLPAASGDFVQVGNEFLDVILDYAQHLAQIKEGMAEITQTLGLYKNFVQAATLQNERLRANAQNFDVLSDRSFKEGQMRPRRTSDLDLQALNYAQSK